MESDEQIETNTNANTKNIDINMKAIRLTVKNIGIIADAVIELNKPLLMFYGEIRQGKTTVLNAVKWVFGGVK